MKVYIPNPRNLLSDLTHLLLLISLITLLLLPSHIINHH